MSNSIIPPQLKKQKLKLKDNFSLVDLAFAIIYAIIALIVGFNLTFVGAIIRVIIGITVFMFLMLTLIKSERYNAKIYMVVIRAFIFLAKKKKFRIDSKDNNTSLLMPYRKLHENCIETSILEGGKKWFIGALEVRGFNISTLDSEEQELRLSQLSNVLRLIDCQMSLVKLDKPYSLDRNLLYLKNIISKLRKLKNNGVLTLEGYNSRMKQIEGYEEIYSDKKGVLGYSSTHKTFTLFIYDLDKAKLYKNMRLIKSKINEINLTALDINKYELVNTIKLIFNPYDNPFTNDEIDEYSDKLNDLLALDNITFSQSNFKINDTYYSLKGIKDYPIYPQNGWMAKLCSTESTVIFNISSTKIEEVKEQLHRAMINARTNIFNVKRTVNRSEKEHQYQSFENLVQLISAGEETVKRINTMFINYGVDKETLHQSEESLDILLKGQNMKIDHLYFKQISGYSGILPKPTDPTAYANSFEMPCSTIGNGYPFMNNSLEDEKGLFVGYNSTGDVVFANQFRRGGDYQNSNAFFIGTTGGGKTTTVSKFLNYHISLGRKVIIIDPKREFGHLCNYHYGNWIDVGTGSKGHFNPLQINVNIDNSISIETIIGDHLQVLETFFHFTHPSLSDYEVGYLTQKLLDFYQSIKVTNEIKFKKMKNSDWPTFSEFTEYLDKQKPDIGEESLLTKISKLIKYDFTGFGKYAALWNHHSSINLSDNLLTVLDIQTLYSKKSVLRAQMFLMLNFIRTEINNNRFNTDNEIILAVDEAHIVIDKDNPQALKFLFETVKMIRGFNGGVMLVTQNLSDFKSSPELEREATAILNNAQYVGVLKLKQKDLQDLSNLYQSSGGLSDNEINYCASAHRGDMLFMASDYNRHCLHVELSEFEQDAVGIKLTED